MLIIFSLLFLKDTVLLLKVVLTLKAIISPEKCDDIINEEILLESRKPNSKSTVNTNDSDICKLDIAEYKTKEHVQSKLSIIINELIMFTIKKHDDDIKFDQIKQFIIQQINKNTDEIIEWLSQNQSKPQYIWFLGLLYHYGIGIDKDNNKAFGLFLKAAKDNYSIA